jgi:hypothetical protein
LPNYLIVIKIPTKTIGVCANYNYFNSSSNKSGNKALVFKYEEGYCRKVGEVSSSFSIKHNRLFFGHLNITNINDRLMVAIESVNGSMPEGASNIKEIDIYTF